MSRRASFSAVDLKRALSAAAKCGLKVSGYEIALDGSIRVLTAEPGATLPSPDQEESAWERAMEQWRRSA